MLVDSPRKLAPLTRHRLAGSPVSPASARLRRSVGALGFAAAFLFGASAAAVRPGDLSTTFPIDDDNPMKSIPGEAARNAAPLQFAYYVQDLLIRTEPALRAKQWEEAAKYYEALAASVPTRAVGFSRLCFIYGQMGKLDLAAANCGRALSKNGVKIMDHVAFVNATLTKGTFDDADAANVERSLAHLRAHLADHPELAEHGGEPEAPAAVPRDPEAPIAAEGPEPSREEIKQQFLADVEESTKAVNDQKLAESLQPKVHVPTEVEVLTCKLAIKLGDAARLEACIGALEALQYDEARLLPLRWALALQNGDGEGATRLLGDAQRLGVAAPALEKMKAGHARLFPEQRASRPWIYGALAALLAGCVGMVAWAARRRRASVETSPRTA